MRFASSAENVNVSTLRATSPMAYFQAFPASRAISVAIPAYVRRQFGGTAQDRRALVSRRGRPVRKSVAGQATARSTAAASATGNSPIVSPEYLSVTRSVVAVAVSGILAVGHGGPPPHVHQAVPPRHTIVVQAE